MKLYTSGSEFVLDTGKYPKGMEGVLMVVKRGDSPDNLKEAIVTVEEMKEMKEVANPSEEWASVGLKVKKAHKPKPEPKPEPVQISVVRPSVRIVEECLACKNARSDARVTRKVALLLSMIGFMASLFYPQVTCGFVLAVSLILTLTAK